ncbi:MAG: ribonuclease III [Planctomycetes bacterium]|nr:ribonuclease III [Planctomycetota bacterium]
MPVLPHEFRDPSLLELALTHSSTGLDEDNERLEYLGDAALDLVVAEELFRSHPDLREGDLTELKSHVVSRTTLARAARQLGLEPLARIGLGLRRRALPASVLANLYEALLGAVYLDGGLEAARAFTHTTLEEPLALARARRGTANPKQELQHRTQQRWNELPVYHLLESRGEAHARAFLVCAQLREERFPSAWGRTLKEAESWAAHEALLVLRERERA